MDCAGESSSGDMAMVMVHILCGHKDGEEGVAADRGVDDALVMMSGAGRCQDSLSLRGATLSPSQL
jgi:hypothetical protein